VSATSLPIDRSAVYGQLGEIHFLGVVGYRMKKQSDKQSLRVRNVLQWKRVCVESVGGRT